MRGAGIQRFEKGGEAGTNLGNPDINNASLRVPPRMTCRMRLYRHLPFLLALHPLPAARDTLTNKPLAHSESLRILVSGSVAQGPPKWGGTMWATVPPAGCLHTGWLWSTPTLSRPVFTSIHLLHQAGTGMSRLVGLTTEMIVWANSLVPAGCGCQGLPRGQGESP